MINPDKLEAIRRDAQSKSDCAYCLEHRGDLEETLLDLWKIAYAARRWISAAAGRDATEAEAKLVEVMEAVKGS